MTQASLVELTITVYYFLWL